ncbi:MAG: energy transducer TonB [Rhodocyclales bacterium]|nr:energy transducer TonB [Rhodocyclales bacterium]
MSISGLRRFPATDFANALPRIARLGAVLLAHGGVAAWALSGIAPARLPPEPLRMDVSLIPYVAPVAPVAPVSLPPPRAETQPLAAPAPTLAPVPKLKPKAGPKTVEPVRQASPAPQPAADVAAEPASVATSAAPLAAATAPAPPALVEARFDADYLRNPAPVYPPMSRRRGEQGKVLVLVAVTPDGLAGEVSLRESSGYPRLDEAALKAVRGWRFVPARRGEAAVATSVVVPITFRLEG